MFLPLRIFWPWKMSKGHFSDHFSLADESVELCALDSFPEPQCPPGRWLSTFFQELVSGQQERIAADKKVLIPKMQRHSQMGVIYGRTTKKTTVFCRRRVIFIALHFYCFRHTGNSWTKRRTPYNSRQPERPPSSNENRYWLA